MSRNSDHNSGVRIVDKAVVSATPDVDPPLPLQPRDDLTRVGLQLRHIVSPTDAYYYAH